MITYTKTVTETLPRLIIRYDECIESPRKDTNLGYFITVEGKYKSPDGKGDVYQIAKTTGDIANDTEEHMKLIKKAISEDLLEKVLAIYPINRMEHGIVVYSMGKKQGFDYSNCGFYIVTDKTQKETGVKKAYFENAIKSELDTCTKWCNGEVYGFELLDEQGNSIDSCGGFYDIDDIKYHLPEEWQNEDMSGYYKHNDTY